MYIAEWLQCSNLGGTAEVIYSFCPFRGDRSFFYYVRVISLKPRYANIGANCESTKYEAIRMAFLYIYKRKGVSHVSRL